MERTLQGDVGSGKTIVAFVGLLMCVEGGKLGALLAPTELLANQHYHDLMTYLSSAGNNGVKVRLCTGAMTPKERVALLADLEAGGVDVLIGTHAIIQDRIISRLGNLGFVVIDEEQRFGVEQRETLSLHSNVLYTSATPIPLSQAKILTSEIKLSTLTEKPSRKRAVETTLLNLSEKFDEVIERLGYHLPKGTKIFWVCPLLQPSETMEGSSATERYDQLMKLYPNQVLLLHGKMTSTEKLETMAKFQQIGGGILVWYSYTSLNYLPLFSKVITFSTTVIELA